MKKLDLLVALVIASSFSLAAPSAEAQRSGRTRTANKNRTKAQRNARARARLAREARRYRRPATPSQRAHHLRVRADRMARIVSRARTSKAAQRYLQKRYNKDMTQLLSSLAKLQKSGKLNATTEHRAMAAAARLLHAARQIDRRQVSSSQADQVEGLLGSAQYRRQAPNHETAVEIETGITTEILAAITTKDGSVAPVLKEGGKPAPEFLKKMARGKDPGTIKWDQLSLKQKHQLLISQSQGRSFFSNRSIPGVQFRRQIDTGNGRKMPVDGVLMKKVEYMGPKAVDKVSGVEFHVRQPARASKNAKQAFELVDAFRSPTRSGHQHMPRRLPRAVLKGNPIARASLVDFYRRVNMVAELAAIQRGAIIKPVKDGSVTYFDFLKSRGLGELNQHLSSMAKTGRPGMAESRLKMGAVGFRTGELYGDKNKFGFEVRVLSKTDKSRGAFVDAVQKGIITGSYGIKASKFQAWHKDRVGKQVNLEKQSRALSEVHYNQPIRALLQRAPSKLEPLLTPTVKTKLQNQAETHYSLKMLVHDWSRDPALHGASPATVDKIVAAQKRGLRAVAKGQDPVRIAQDFATGSGLYEVFAGSIGM